MAQFDLALPKFGANDLDDEKQRRRIMNYLVKLDEQLRFVLNNLDTENFTETFQQIYINNAGGDQNGSGETLAELQDEIARLSTRITQTANEIALKASAEQLNELGDAVSAMAAEINILADQISSKVSQTEFDALGQTVSEHSTSITQTAEKIESTAKAVDDLGGRVTTAETVITQTAEKIESKAEKSVVDALGKTVSEHSTAITQTAEKIESKAEKSEVNALGRTVSENSTKITQTAETIESTAESVEALAGRVQKNESSIAQTPAKIELAVSSIQVGGRNLIPDSGDLKTANYAIDASGASAKGTCTEDGDGGFHIVCNDDGQNVRWWLGYFDVTPGLSYAVSVRYRVNSGEPPIQFQYVFRNAGGSVVQYAGSLSLGVTQRYVENGWTVLTNVFTVPDKAEITNMRLGVRTGLDRELYTCDYNIKRPKLETGNKATDWSPAPEDAEAKIDSLSAELAVQAGSISANATKIETVGKTATGAQSAAAAAQSTANAAQTQANTNKTNLSGVTTRVTKAEANITALDGKISTKVSQTDFDALGDVVAENSSEIAQTPAKIELAVSSIQVGGTNLVCCADGKITVSTGSINRNANPAWYTKGGYLLRMAPYTGNHNIIRFLTDLPVRPGEQYMLSFCMWTYGIDVVPTIRCNFLGSDPNSVDYAFKNIVPTANTPVRYEVPMTIPSTWTSGQKVNLRFYTASGGNFTTGYVYFSDVKLEKGNKATAWSPCPDDPAESVNAGGVVRVDQTGVHMTGGTIEMETSDGEEYIYIKNSGVTASSLEAPNVARRYAGASAITVDPNATGAQLAAGGYCRTLAEACAALSWRYLDRSVTITVLGDHYGDAALEGVTGGGDVTILGSGFNLYGTLILQDCTVKILIDWLRITRSATAAFAVGVRNVSYLELTSCVISGRGSNTDIGLEIWDGSKVRMYGCELYSAAYLIWMSYCTLLQAYNLSGSGTYFIATNGCEVRWHGTRPGGALYPLPSPSACIPADLSTLEIDYGSAAPTAPTVTTASYSYLYSDSYCAGWSHFDDEDPRQGFIQRSSSATGAVYGVIWFDAAAIQSALSGKTVNQASLRLHMQKGVGRGAAVGIQLYGTNKAYSGRSGAPGLTTSYGTIGTISPDETAEITIPAQAVKDIVAGTICALVLKSDDAALYKERDYSKNYARFSGSGSATAENCPRLTVVYQ